LDLGTRKILKRQKELAFGRPPEKGLKITKTGTLELFPIGNIFEACATGRIPQMPRFWANEIPTGCEES
jgi:hypothetical protein